ncbi:hypothetical protein HGRIS_006474 [Hohenbuehelia grisea]|uniref:Uncharacterized protein n=1 Tax=Hohenbuehelia grisea TaxID=104357 RepID=A0ABR3K001_9AGAR
MFREDDYREDYNSDDIDQNQDFALPLKNSTQDFSLLEPHFDCGVGVASGSATFKLSASADIDMTLAAGFKIRGNIIPPEVSLFHMYGKMDGHVVGSIKIAGSATGDLDATIEQEIGFNYKVNEVRMYFPETGEHKISGTVEAVETPMDIKLGKQSTRSLNLSAHFMPLLAIGVKIPTTEAQLFAEIDISGAAGLSFKRKKEEELRRRANRFAEVARHAAARNVAIKHDLQSRDLLDLLKEYGMEGSAINIGTSASSLGLFDSDPDHKFEVWGSEPWELFKKCTSDDADAATEVRKPEGSVLSQEFAAAIEEKKSSGVGLNYRSLPRRNAIENRGSKMECSADLHPGSLATVLHESVQAKKLKA